MAKMAEGRRAIERVAVLEKENEELRARVDELEAAIREAKALVEQGPRKAAPARKN